MRVRPYHRSILLLSVLLSVSACQPRPNDSKDEQASSTPAEAITLKTLRLDVSENSLSKSKEFEYFAGGHFGEKTQYNGKIADEFGGAYAVHCRSGKPFSIEVKYQGAGIKRDDAMKVMQRLLPPDSGEVVEHDDEDVKKMDAKQAAEWFYYKGGARTELLYADNSNQNVVQVNIWTKSG